MLLLLLLGIGIRPHFDIGIVIISFLTRSISCCCQGCFCYSNSMHTAEMVQMKDFCKRYNNRSDAAVCEAPTQPPIYPNEMLYIPA
uniref:Putative secreted protein n=1 Tax=Anopheles darlingi TaxID=43151 RepID=A0A2M4DHC8_ANODA